MIDKLDVRIPCDTPFHPDFAKIYRELRTDANTNPFRPSRHYVSVADLREFDFSVVLHMGSRWGKYGSHKLEVVDTGKMSYGQIVNEIERVFEIDANRLEVMRLDLAADIAGITVGWFQARVKAKYKQCLTNFGSGEFIEMGKGGIQTLYFGKRPNVFRIYDKIAEYKQQYAQLRRKSTSGGPLPAFQDLYGHVEGEILTRVERQIGGGKVPTQLATVKDLRNCPNFRPFDPLQIVSGGSAEPNPAEFHFTTYCAGMFLREKAEREGMHCLLKFIARYSNKNTGWALNRFRDFLPTKDAHEMVNADYLNEKFRLSIERQLRT